MGRNKRIQLENVIYHVIARGNSGQNIFLSNLDRKFFLSTLSNFSEEFNIDILSYVLMDNHYHLLIRTNKPNLAAFMHKLDSKYAHNYNYFHGLSGHLFQGRYKNYLIKDNQHFISALRYIALNPVVAGMVNKAEEYVWGSYKLFFDDNVSAWVKIYDALNFVEMSREEFIVIMDAPTIDYVDFLSFETIMKPGFDDVANFIRIVEREIDSLNKNSKLKEVVIYRLLQIGASKGKMSKFLNVSRWNLEKTYENVEKQLEKGNLLYVDLMERIKNIKLVPGTNRGENE